MRNKRLSLVIAMVLGVMVLPAGAAERAASVYEQLGIESPWAGAVGTAINPDDYECGPTDLGNYIGGLFGSVNPDALDAIFGVGALIWPEVYTVLFDNDPSDTEIGANGEHTREQIKRQRDNQRFWDVPSGDIQLHGMHGADIADDAKMVPLVEFLLGAPPADAQDIVDFIQELIESDPILNYDYPLFSLNAFAVSFDGEEFPGFGAIPDKIVMGDGLLQVVSAIGFDTNGPDLIHSHEFAHHVQFEIGAFETDIDNEPEATRRTELMADAFAGFNLAHARGATFQTKRIVEAVVTSLNAGDCGFASPGHHGTPNQRAAAATWGAELAQSARPQGKILSAATMLELFDAELASFVAPDAG